MRSARSPKNSTRDQEFVLTPEKKARLIASVPEEVKRDIRFAYDQITAFARAQRESIHDFEMITPAGVRAGQKVVPMDVAGCYIPGGRFAHTCSALMSIATAKVAGVPFVIAATPPRGDSIDPSVCYAMDLAGADIILEMGGVPGPSPPWPMACSRENAPTSSPAPATLSLPKPRPALPGEGVCGIDLFAGLPKSPSSPTARLIP